MTGPLAQAKTRVTVQRATSNNYNDRTFTDHHQIDGCALSPVLGSEQGAPADTVITDVRSLYLPVGSDITAYDRVLVHPPGVVLVPANDRATRRANTYEVMGSPTDWANIYTGWHPGMQASLQRVSG